MYYQTIINLNLMLLHLIWLLIEVPHVSDHRLFFFSIWRNHFNNGAKVASWILFEFIVALWKILFQRLSPFLLQTEANFHRQGFWNIVIIGMALLHLQFQTRAVLVLQNDVLVDMLYCGFKLAVSDVKVIALTKGIRSLVEGCLVHGFALLLFHSCFDSKNSFWNIYW